MRSGRMVLACVVAASISACGRAGDQAGKPAGEHAHDMTAAGRDASKDTAEVQALKAAAEMRDNVAATRRGISAGRESRKREQNTRPATNGKEFRP